MLPNIDEQPSRCLVAIGTTKIPNCHGNTLEKPLGYHDNHKGD